MNRKLKDSTGRGLVASTHFQYDRFGICGARERHGWREDRAPMEGQERGLAHITNARAKQAPHSAYDELCVLFYSEKSCKETK